MGTTLEGLKRKVIFQQKKQLDLTTKEGMRELVKSIKTLEPPTSDAWALSFIMKNQDQDLLVHIAIPPPHTDIKELTPKDYQIKEVMLGSPTVNTLKVIITMGMKEVFRHMDYDESKFPML